MIDQSFQCVISQGIEGPPGPRGPRGEQAQYKHIFTYDILHSFHLIL